MGYAPRTIIARVRPVGCHTGQGPEKVRNATLLDYLTDRVEKIPIKPAMIEMGIKNACFISYCHGEGRLMNRFVEEFKEALSSSIEPYLDIKIFIDHERLGPGYRYNDALAQAICESLCMVSIVVPKYFKHDYCLQEVVTMEKIQKIRTKKIGQPALENRGLIIPVVLRGEVENLPEKMKKHIHCCNFSKFNTSSPKICETGSFVDKIDEIAKYIYELHEIFIKDNSILSFNCERFKFAKVNETWQPKDTTPLSPFHGARC